MKQEQIRYGDIIELGFKEEFCNDTVYEYKYGFQYVIITLNLTKRIFIDWEKETRLCEMVRLDKDHNVKARKPIMNLEELKEIIEFFKSK
jgi:hypothetical protein